MAFTFRLKTRQIEEVDTDITLASDSNSLLSTQKAVKSYIDVQDHQKVNIVGDELIGGVKTFNEFPIVPSGVITTDYQATSKKYVDDSINTFSLSLNNYLYVRDEKAANSDGGTFTSGDWVTRTLNTVMSNSITGASLDTNTITLPAGTYHIFGTAPAYVPDRHKLKLRNITESTDIIVGASNVALAANDASNSASVKGRFILTGTTAIQLQHRCQTTSATFGLGVACNLGVIEVYAELEIWKIG